MKAEEIIGDLLVKIKDTKNKRPAKLAVKEITKLTAARLEDVIDGLARQTARLEEENEELREQVEDITAARDSWREKAKPSLRRQEFLSKIEQYSSEDLGEQAAPAAEAVASAQSPPAQQGQVAPVAADAGVAAVVGMESGSEVAAGPSPWRSLMSGLAGRWFPGLKKRKADDALDDAPTPKARAVESSENTPIGRPIAAKHLMRSAKDLNVPSSLSTVTEYTEPPSMLETDTTPSKPARLPPATPRRTPAAVRRAQRTSRSASNTPARVPWVGERNMAKEKPKQPNADARIATIQQWHDIKKEYERLRDDPVVKEVEGHGRKRVKVDNLPVIPHNRPGDSSSTFRVPDIDSDDEMEVDEEVEETTNVFEDSEKLQEKTPGTTPMRASTQPTTTPLQQPSTQRTATPLQQQSTQQTMSSLQPPATQQTTTSLPQPSPSAQQATTEEPTFDFPDVAPWSPSMEVSEEFKEQAGQAFAKGFAAWLAAR